MRGTLGVLDPFEYDGIVKLDTRHNKQLETLMGFTYHGFDTILKSRQAVCSE